MVPKFDMHCPKNGPLLAGGGDSIVELPVQLEPKPATHSHPQVLRVSGLMGGHSGLNISEDRGNAVALVTLVLQAVVKAHPDVRIVSLTAGDKRNAIAREASAVLEVSHSVNQSIGWSTNPVSPMQVTYKRTLVK